MSRGERVTVTKTFSTGGFSLIEAAISLLIVGIVSSICMTQLALFTTIDRARKTQEHCRVIINALGAYFIATEGGLPDPVEKTTDGFGNVPFKELGIMEKFSKDGNGRNMLYKVNPYIGIQINDPRYTKLGIEEFAGTYADKIAIILKSVDTKGNELYKIWISERNFKSMFRIQQKLEFSGEIKPEKTEDREVLSGVGGGGGLEDDD